MKKTIVLFFLFLAMAIVFVAYRSWAGSTMPFFGFYAAMFVMIALAFVRPISFAYGYFSLFLFLGFFGKLTLHLIAGLPFIEPTGAFDGSASSWDTTAIVSMYSALGVATARLCHILVLRWKSFDRADLTRSVPVFYLRNRKALWSLCIVMLITLNLWNSKVAFYQIGVNPKLVLPVHLNVIMAWLINWGFGFILACMVDWEMRQASQPRYFAIGGTLFEAALASVSSLSRSAYLFHGAAGVLAWIASWKQRKQRPPNTMIFGVLVAFLFGLFATILTVQSLRANQYFAQNTLATQGEKSVSSKESNNNQYQKGMLMQIPWLIVNRWVGLEAVLAVTAHPNKSTSLLIEGITEDPRNGVDSIYQRIAGSSYVQSDRFTFLTLAGITAIFFYSGSFTVVCIGMLSITTILLLIEITAVRSIGNPYVASLAGISMAYTVTQVTFPYLTAVFFLELIATLLAIVFIEWIARTRKK